MWKALAEWLLTLLNMTRELEENRTSIRELEKRMRDIEEALKLLALELRHTREMDSVEREKSILQLERDLAKLKELPRGKKNR
jgi:hypothetical protein